MLQLCIRGAPSRFAFLRFHLCMTPPPGMALALTHFTAHALDRCGGGGAVAVERAVEEGRAGARAWNSYLACRDAAKTDSPVIIQMKSSL